MRKKEIKKKDLQNAEEIKKEMQKERDSGI